MKIKFWKDRWCDNNSLEEPFLESVSITSTKDALVDEQWEQSGEGGSWDPQFTRQDND